MSAGSLRRPALAGVVLVAMALGAIGCGDSEGFERREVAEVQAALEGEGLQICSSRSGEELPPEAESERLLVVAQDCSGDEDERTSVQITAWEDEPARDAAAARFESQTRPRSIAYGAVWTLGDLTIELAGPREDTTADRVGEAMDRLGAGD